MKIQQHELLKLTMLQQISEFEFKAIEELIDDFPIFKKWIEYTLSFKEIVNEMNNYNFLNENNQTFLKPHVKKKEGNVYYINFHKDKMAPLVIYLNNFESNLFVFEQLKLNIFPLIELCSIQRRDCIIHLASGEIIQFPYDDVKANTLNAFYSIKCKNAPKSCANESQNIFKHFGEFVTEECEVMIVSGSPIHIEVSELDFLGEFSAMLLHEEIFANSVLPQLHKVYFIQDVIVDTN